MTSIELRGVSKAFPERPPILAGIDLQVADGEFVVLVGPNGSGKSTLLRMIAGLESVSTGEIRIGGHLANDWTPRRRNVAMVFQSGVVYPHLTVERNLRFGVEQAASLEAENSEAADSESADSGTADRDGIAKTRTEKTGTFKKGRWWTRICGRWTNRSPDDGRPRSQVQGEPNWKRAALDDRVRETARRLGIESLLDRYPRQLSGGERQRVALGRAFVRQPAVFLLDEPFANADSELRQSMRELVREWNTGGGKATTFLVTHDHAEALAWGCRTVVLGDGKVQQDGTAEQICRRPENVFVASFFGTEPMSSVLGRIRHDDGRWWFESPLGSQVLETAWLRDELLKDGMHVRLGWRPSAARARSGEDSATALDRIAGPGWSWQGVVGSRELGEQGWLVAVAPEAGPTVLARWESSEAPRIEQRVRVCLDWERCWWFDSTTGRNLAAKAG